MTAVRSCGSAVDCRRPWTTTVAILAITVIPGRPGSEELATVAEPERRDGELLVEMVALGVCGTDREIVSGTYSWPPADRDRLVLGHESLGRVREAPDGAELVPGDLVVGIVRRPDPEPCPSCAAGEWDFCRNGRYTERGIKALHGFGSERWRIEPEFAVKLDPSLGLLGVLMEPTTIVAKAWEQIDRIAQRATIAPQRVLVTGAGPIGLLAALRRAVHLLPGLGQDRGGLEQHSVVAQRRLEPDDGVGLRPPSAPARTRAAA